MADEVGTLITECERIFRDTVGADSEKLISQVEWIEYLANAEAEICRRAFVLNTTSTITMAASTHTYSLSRHILTVGDKAYFNYDQSYMEKATEDWLDRNLPPWRNTYGTPTKFVVYPTNDEMRVTPIPPAAISGYTVILNIATLPTTTIAAAGDTPEISSKYYSDMKLWALHKAYSKNDVEINLPDGSIQNLSGKYLALFEASVGPRSNANVERIVKEEPSYMRIGVYR